MAQAGSDPFYDQVTQPIIYGDGSQRRCFSFVADVVPSLVRLGVDPDIRSEVFNLGPDERVVTVLDLAREIADLLSFELAPIFVPQRPLEVQDAFCSSDKARKLLGYRTTCDLQEGLIGMIAWLRAMGPRESRYDYEIEIRNELTPRTWTETII